MMLAQAEDVGDGSEDELFLAQMESEFLGFGDLKQKTNWGSKVPLDEAACDAAKSDTRRWWEVWYDWEDDVCKCWGWTGEEEDWITVTRDVNANSRSGARC